MSLHPPNSSNLEQLVLKGLKQCTESLAIAVMLCQLLLVPL